MNDSGLEGREGGREIIQVILFIILFKLQLTK